MTDTAPNSLILRGSLFSIRISPSCASVRPCSPLMRAFSGVARAGCSLRSCSRGISAVLIVA
jgi:hypothetical protein